MRALADLTEGCRPQLLELCRRLPRAIAILLLLLGAAAGARAEDSAVLRSRFLTPEVDRIRQTTQRGASMPLRLFDDASFAAVLDRVVVDQRRTLHWYGHLAGELESRVLLVVRDDVVVGVVEHPDGSFQIRPVGGSLHVIEQLDPERFPPDLAVPVGRRAATDARPRAASAEAAADSVTNLDVLVLYTRAARREAGGRAGVEALIDLGVAETNLALADSRARARFRLVGARRVAYVESGSTSTDLDRLRRSGDGYLARAQRLRDKRGADFVQLIVAEIDTEYCGSAYLLGDGEGIPPEHEPYAFGVTRVDCVSPGYTFGHELGHNMGLEHARQDDGEKSPALPYSFGYREPAGFFRTMMALWCRTCGPRFLHFSNPKVTLRGRPTGVGFRQEHSAHAVRSINKTREVLAAFRDCKVDCEEPAARTAGRGL